MLYIGYIRTYLNIVLFQQTLCSSGWYAFSFGMKFDIFSEFKIPNLKYLLRRQRLKIIGDIS